MATAYQLTDGNNNHHEDNNSLAYFNLLPATNQQQQAAPLAGLMMAVKSANKARVRLVTGANNQCYNVASSGSKSRRATNELLSLDTNQQTTCCTIMTGGDESSDALDGVTRNSSADLQTDV